MPAMSEQQQPNFPLDCPNGLSCGDYECELRHLDAEEQDLRREATPGASSGACSSGSNAPPKVIITASRDMGRSASTWVFNAVRLLLLQAGVFCDSYWMRTLSPERIERRIQAAKAMQLPGQPSVVPIKTHEYESGSPEFFQNSIRPLLSHIIVSVRQGFQPDAFWVEHSTHVVQYEDIVVSNPSYDASVGAMSVLNDLARHLGVPPLSHGQLRQIDYRLMTMPIPGDQSTKFWSFHGRRGGRATPVPPDTLREQKKHQPIQHHIFVTRHGARQDNGPDRDSQWLAKVGHRRRQDAPLSPHGHNAAKELAGALMRYRDDERQESFIVSSPLIRCMETAQAVSQVWKVPIRVEPGISEVGTRPSHVGSLEELQRKFTIDTAYEPVMAIDQLPQHKYGDGAAARRAEKVATNVVERIIRDHEKDRSFNILFVGHGASCLGLVRAFGAPSGYVGYCSLSKFKLTEADRDDEKAWSLVGKLGDVEHLSDQETALGSAW